MLASVFRACQATLCAKEMGLRWIGFAADGALPQPLPPPKTTIGGGGGAQDGPKLAPWPDYRAYRYPPKANTYSLAHVNATALLSVVRDAMRADWRRALSGYPLPVFGLLSRQEWLTASGTTTSGGTRAASAGPTEDRDRHWHRPPPPPHATIEALLRLPQYGVAAHGTAVSARSHHAPRGAAPPRAAVMASSGHLATREPRVRHVTKRRRKR